MLGVHCASNAKKDLIIQISQKEEDNCTLFQMNIKEYI